MIRPGLARIRRLLQDRHLPWKAVHVAGTNGKGSICFYLSSLLSRSNLRTGRFTSPHLLDRWDCIAIDGAPISESLFLRVEEDVKRRNDAHAIDASEFELLTATAFELFTSERVDIAVVECGMGGREDATNILRQAQKLVTVIARVGLDHQAFLGTTLAAIAREKAGIMLRDVPCVIDGESDAEAVRELKRVAADKMAPLHIVSEKGNTNHDGGQGIRDTALDSGVIDSDVTLGLPVIQRQNLRVALRAFSLAASQLDLRVGDDASKLLRETALVRPPARFQTIDLSKLAGRKQTAVLDGAHNVQAFTALLEEVHLLREGGGIGDLEHITWVIACSKGKDAAEMFGAIPRTDSVVLTRFGPVDGMPWVAAMEAADVMPWRVDGQGEGPTHVRLDLLEALRLAASLGNKIVVAGSLYLASDVLRLLRDFERKT